MGSVQKRLGRFFAISRELTADFATLCLLDALQGPDEAATQRRTLALLSHPDFTAWSEQHGEVFYQHFSAQMGAAGSDVTLPEHQEAQAQAQKDWLNG